MEDGGPIFMSGAPIVIATLAAAMPYPLLHSLCDQSSSVLLRTQHHGWCKPISQMRRPRLREVK
jgi:hypothetical protein